MKRSTPLTDEFDSGTLLDDITNHPHREWRKAVAHARKLEKKLELAMAKLEDIDRKAHGFRLCFPYESIGDRAKIALFKNGSYYYYVPAP
jgi:hypothetical protein